MRIFWILYQMLLMFHVKHFELRCCWDVLFPSFISYLFFLVFPTRSTQISSNKQHIFHAISLANPFWPLLNWKHAGVNKNICKNANCLFLKSFRNKQWDFFCGPAAQRREWESLALTHKSWGRVNSSHSDFNSSGPLGANQNPFLSLWRTLSDCLVVLWGYLCVVLYLFISTPASYLFDPKQGETFSISLVSSER